MNQKSRVGRQSKYPSAMLKSRDEHACNVSISVEIYFGAKLSFRHSTINFILMLMSILKSRTEWTNFFRRKIILLIKVILGGRLYKLVTLTAIWVNGMMNCDPGENVFDSCRKCLIGGGERPHYAVMIDVGLG